MSGDAEAGIQDLAGWAMNGSSTVTREREERHDHKPYCRSSDFSTPCLACPQTSHDHTSYEAVQELENDAQTRHSHGVAAVLVITSGEQSGDRVELTDTVVIGRAGTDLVLDDPEVSRRHAEIRERGGRFEIEDLGSRNGTRLNGQPVDRITPLTNGAHIRIGRTDLVLEIPAEAPATVVSDSPRSAETAATSASAGGSPLFPGQANTPPRRIGSRQSIFMVFTFSLMLLVPAALVIYFWQVG